jgi:hypothetical protein
MLLSHNLQTIPVSPCGASRARRSWRSVQARTITMMASFVVGACGAKEGNGPAGSHDAGGTESQPTGDCPQSIPTSGSRCAMSGLTCEYGNDPSATCDTLVMCTGGAWVTSQEPVDAGCSTSNGANCPTAFANVMEGATCGSTPFDCYYPEARCSCAPLVLQGACRPPDCPAPTWNCDTPAADIDGMLQPESGCPVPRPRIGSPCSDADFERSCNYGYCQGGVAILCTSNVWQVQTVPCPK